MRACVDDRTEKYNFQVLSPSRLALALVLTLAATFGAGAVVYQLGGFDGTFAPGLDQYNFLVSRIAKLRLQRLLLTVRASPRGC